jgi:hypothetical protein
MIVKRAESQRLCHFYNWLSNFHLLPDGCVTPPERDFTSIFMNIKEFIPA